MKTWMGQAVGFVLGLFVLAMLVPAVSPAVMYGPADATDFSSDAGKMYWCSSTGTVQTAVGVSVSSPVLSLFNPFGSNVNLTVLEVAVSANAAVAGATGFFMAYNVVPSSGIQAGTGISGNLTTALIGKSTSTQTTTSLASCMSQGILPAVPIPFRWFGDSTGASSYGGVIVDQTDGKVVVPPGGLLSIQASALAVVQSSILYREDPL